MEHYRVSMKHSEESLKTLSGMQYHFFRVKSRISRMIICAACLIAGASHINKWWGILLLIYGCFLLTSESSVAVHSADRVIDQLKKNDIDYPETIYYFRDEYIEIVALPMEEQLAPLYYNNVHMLAMDDKYYVIFKDKFGGYIISKECLGTKCDEFRKFMERKCGMNFVKHKKRGFAFLLNRQTGLTGRQWRK